VALSRRRPDQQQRAARIYRRISIMAATCANTKPSRAV